MDVGVYEEPRLDVPTFFVDTVGEYLPSIAELGEAIPAYNAAR